jgi:hypothetical protein
MVLVEKCYLDNPLTPFVKGELDDDLIYSPLLKVDKGRFFYNDLVTKLDFARLQTQNSPLKKGVRGLFLFVSAFIRPKELGYSKGY